MHAINNWHRNPKKMEQSFYFSSMQSMFCESAAAVCNNPLKDWI